MWGAWRTASLTGALAVAMVVGSGGPVRAAAQIQSQAPCNSGGEACFNFGVGIVGVGQFSMRSFSFRAPSKGTAQVTFHGSLLCGAETTRPTTVVNLVTQVVNSTNVTATPSGPGGLRQALVLRPNTSDTLNLASTRSSTFAGTDTQTCHYRVRPLRIDAGANRYIYNAAFTVLFIS